jgi:electron transfer flavoprotein beta subunit
MNLLICIKQVPDMESTFRPSADGKWYEEEDIAFRINEYDAFALEAAIRIAEEEAGAHRLTALTVGPDRATEALRRALAMGCDRAVHVCDEAVHERDPFQIASLIHAWNETQGEGFDLVFTGIQSTDTGSGQVASLLGALLDIPVVSGVSSLARDSGRMRARIEIEGGVAHTVRVAPPAVISFHTGPAAPRYPAVPAIMRARSKPLERVELASLPLAQSRVDTVSVLAPAGQPAAVFLEGEPDDVAERLVALLERPEGARP